jgi:CheY-like chemotaxis protein
MIAPHAVTSPIVHLFDGPKWPAGATTPGADRRDPVTNGKQIRIIVIDDETLIAQTVAEILNQEGFVATAVPSGHSAVELAKTWEPDVVLSDVIMPGLNGIETGRRIREVAPSCKIILFSGQAATVDLLEQARRRGEQFQILAKPIKPERLVSAIRTAYARG